MVLALRSSRDVAVRVSTLALFLGAACRGAGTAPESTGSPQSVADSTGPSLLARGRERWASGDVDAALEAFGAAAESGSVTTRVEALRWIAHAHMTRSDPEAALSAFQAARALDDADAWLCYGEGTAWSLMGELQAAERCYGAAISRDPGHVKALQWRGETRLLLHDAEGAVEDFTRALALLDAAADADLAAWGGDRTQLLSMTLALRSEALSALGRFEEATRDQERRTQLRPDG